MASPLRVEYPGAYSQVMNRGMERRRTFRDEENHDRFVRLGFLTSPPRAEKTPQFPDIATVIAQMSELFSVSTESVFISRRDQENIPRNLAIFIASRLAGFSHREIEEVFHLRSDSAVSRVCQRTQAHLDRNPELRRRMEKLGNLKD